MNFINWHYLEGWRWYWKRVGFNLKKMFHYFAFGTLARTIFKPWKRMEIDTDMGFDIVKYFENLSFNLISSMIGAWVRITLMLVAMMIALGYLGLSVGWFLVWWLIPIFGFDGYKYGLKEKNNELKELEIKIRNNPEKMAQIILTSEMGKFLLERTEKKIEEILAKMMVKNEDLGDLKVDNYENLIGWWLSKNGQIERELQQFEMTKEELLLAARWWDEKQSVEKEKEEDKWSLGRPGIGWGLMFGYTPKLDKYSEDLSMKQSFSEHLIGREKIVKKMESVINSGKNILLTGNPGVGRMTVVYEFAERAITGKLGKSLMNKKLVLLDYQSALAGNEDKDTKKKILKDLMKEAEGAGNIILVVKDLYRIINADFEGNDFADVIDSVLRDGKLKMISVMGRVEYERFVAGDLRVAKNFEVVEVLAPSKEEALVILMWAVNRMERKEKIKFSIQALKQIIEGSDKYITETPFPEKALELMDWTVESKTMEGWVNKEDVNRVLSEKTGIVVTSLTESEKDKLGKLEEQIEKELIGQEAAVKLIGKSLRSRVVAAKSEEKPIGSFLFLGPTGVGKTQTAKVLADIYFGSRKNILRFDMAEYVGNDGLMKLIGSVERNIPGLMTTEIKNKPASLLLLDEIEKAPSEIFNLFLTMLDEGYINDAKGNKIVCRHLFVVATSNAGAEFIRQQVQNGIKGEELQKSVVDYVQKERLFSPEFLNRFDGVVVFEPLVGENLVEVAKLMLRDFSEALMAKSINVEFDESVARKVAKDGFTIEFGARPMRRVVDLVLGDIIGRAMIDNKIRPGDKVKVVAGEGKDEYLVQNPPSLKGPFLP